MKIIKKNEKKEQGVALVLTIMVVSIIILVSSSMATLAIIELRVSKTVDEQMAAYYVAESGLEHGLYLYNTRDRAVLDETDEQKEAQNIPWKTTYWCIDVVTNTSLSGLDCPDNVNSNNPYFDLIITEIDCDSKFRCINSVGHYISPGSNKETIRKLQIMVQK